MPPMAICMWVHASRTMRVRCPWSDVLLRKTRRIGHRPIPVHTSYSSIAQSVERMTVKGLPCGEFAEDVPFYCCLFRIPTVSRPIPP